jgi:hypothetical protein
VSLFFTRIHFNRTHARDMNSMTPTHANCMALPAI